MACAWVTMAPALCTRPETPQLHLSNQRKVSSSQSQDIGAWVSGWWPHRVCSHGTSHMLGGLTTGVDVSSKRCPGLDINRGASRRALCSTLQQTWHPAPQVAPSACSAGTGQRKTRKSLPHKGRASTRALSDRHITNPTSFSWRSRTLPPRKWTWAHAGRRCEAPFVQGLETPASQGVTLTSAKRPSSRVPGPGSLAAPSLRPPITVTVTQPTEGATTPVQCFLWSRF